MTPRIVFVDDEPNVLAGLRRMLFAHRREWDMVFVESGPAAIDALAAGPVDVLVTDVRMPGMNGDDLLASVRRLRPQAVRIVLTGQCTRETMLRLARLAHRVFTKPCDPDELREALRRACSLRQLLRSPVLEALVGRLGGLPTPPALYTQIIAELERPDGSLADVGKLLARDVATSAKLLQLANSSLVGLRHRAITPTQAVQALGAEATKALLLVSEILTRYDPVALRPYSIDGLWDHSREVAALASAITQAEGASRPTDDARLAGLLHDVGRLTLAAQLPGAYRDALCLVEEDGLAVVEAERQVFGTTHAEVGAYLLGLWGLPDALVEVVAWHHAPSRCPVDGFGPLTAVHAAEAILAPDEAGPPDATHLGRLGLADRPPRWGLLRTHPQHAGANP